MSEKIRLVLVAKRDKLMSMKGFTADEAVLLEWLKMQKSYRLHVNHIEDELKTRMAKTLVEMFGEPHLKAIYDEDESLTQSEKYEKMLEEILHDEHIRTVAELHDGDMFGEQAILREHVRTASVRCIEDTHLAYITKHDFQKMYNNILKAKKDKRI
jgi:hypothetical protein